MPQRTQLRRGATTITMTVLLSVVCAILMLVVELGRMQVVKSEIQNAVDAGALAGALKFRQNSSDVTGALNEAERYVQLNHVGITQLIGADAIVAQAGFWDITQETFTPTNVSPNSIRVQATRLDEPFFLASLFGKTNFSVPASAVAAIGNTSLDVMLAVDLANSMGDDGKIEALQTTLPFFVNLFDGLGGNDQIGVMGISADPGSYNPAAQGHGGVIYTPAMSCGDDFVGVLESGLTSNFTALKNNALNTNALTAGKYGNSSHSSHPVVNAHRFNHALRDSADYLMNGPAGRNQATKVIVLLTDGNPSAPPSSAISSTTMSTATTQCRIFVVTVGDNANTGAMGHLADACGGEHLIATGSNETELTASLKTALGKVTSAIKRSSIVQ
ncbi:MAG TPA: hypothetical protein DCY79_10630 [Planctomycetaceae bacterium]|nr:hypothetical protein [Planctomycetaceae bacterium]